MTRHDEKAKGKMNVKSPGQRYSKEVAVLRRPYRCALESRKRGPSPGRVEAVALDEALCSMCNEKKRKRDDA